MSMLKKVPLLAIFSFWISVQASTPDIKEAMVVSFSGTVEIFTAVETETNLTGKSLVLFDGHKFISRRVQSGAKIHPGDIVRSGNDGKMKLVYSNGDVFILGPATAFVIPAKIDKGSNASEVSSEVLYGKVRAVIDKKGPLSGFKIKTQSVVSGVRGTDLYVINDPLSKRTLVHVLRGEVEVQSVASLDKNSLGKGTSVFVKTGQKGVYDVKDSSSTEALQIRIQSSTQQELKQIQNTTTTPPPQIKDFSAEDKVKLDELLKNSQEKVMEDIKQTTPEVFKSMQGKKVENLEAITQVMVQNLAKTAPNDSSKPKLSDFDKDEDIYKKYFKPVEK